MIVTVYRPIRNQKRVYAIRRGQEYWEQEEVFLEDAKFLVFPIMKSPSRQTIHAVVKGKLSTPPEGFSGRKIFYSASRSTAFQFEDTLEPIYEAKYVYLKRLEIEVCL